MRESLELACSRLSHLYSRPTMKTSDFDYHLPLERIAQTPIEPRHASRLLVLRRDRAELEHSRFWELGEFLNPGDLLVINQTRVIPARLYAHKDSGGRDNPGLVD